LGADAAELSGELSALTLVLDRAVHPGDAEPLRRRAKYLERRIQNITRFRAGLETAFPCPDDWIEQLTDETIICRCEEITFGHIRDAITTCDIREVNRLKALSRAGMGRCQGRMCSQPSAEILAHLTKQPLLNVGRLRGQPPIKPVPAHILAEASTPKTETAK
jgi:bacterioferritin-associated ferredoxin